MSMHDGMTIRVSCLYRSQSFMFVEFLLKTHRSAEDYLFVSPRVPSARDNRSAPPADRSQRKTSPGNLAHLPQSQNLQTVITTQQRHSIIASLNGEIIRCVYEKYPASGNMLPCIIGG